MISYWKNLSGKKQDFAIAVANIMALVVATGLIGWNYFDQGLVYQFANNEFMDVVTYFESKPFAYQVALVMFFVLVEVIIGLIPAVVMYPIIGALIGPAWGILLIGIGNVIGNSVNYYQGKVIARAFISDKKHLSLIQRLQDGGAWSLFFIRLNPLTSFDAISYFAGALGMKYKKFITATLLGITPLVVIGTLAGGEIMSEFEWSFELLVILTIGYLVYTIIKAKPAKKLFKRKKKTLEL
jgi:uncharacterized membrane protein YdjX (TVP38/TMEM64 family)